MSADSRIKLYSIINVNSSLKVYSFTKISGSKIAVKFESCTKFKFLDVTWCCHVNWHLMTTLFASYFKFWRTLPPFWNHCSQNHGTLTVKCARVWNKRHIVFSADRPPLCAVTKFEFSVRFKYCPTFFTTLSSVLALFNY